MHLCSIGVQTLRTQDTSDTGQNIVPVCACIAIVMLRILLVGYSDPRHFGPSKIRTGHFGMSAATCPGTSALVPKCLLDTSALYLRGRQLRPISAHNVSTVGGSEQGSITTNIKLTTGFPTSH